MRFSLELSDEDAARFDELMRKGYTPRLMLANLCREMVLERKDDDVGRDSGKT